MILYSLKCGNDHVFDEWFSNSADYDAKAAAGEIACPECGDKQVAKAIMAPRLGKQTAEPPSCGAAAGGGCGGCAFAG